MLTCHLRSPVPLKPSPQPLLIHRTLLTLFPHLSFAPTSVCGVVETRLRTPSLPSPPLGVRCPPPWARAAQASLLWCSALGRWPPGETRPDLTVIPLHGRTGAASSWEPAAVFSKLLFLLSFPTLGDSSVVLFISVPMLC